jgi:hypothetical protein
MVILQPAIASCLESTLKSFTCSSRWERLVLRVQKALHGLYAEIRNPHLYAFEFAYGSWNSGFRSLRRFLELLDEEKLCISILFFDNLVQSKFPKILV